MTHKHACARNLDYGTLDMWCMGPQPHDNGHSISLLCLLAYRNVDKIGTGSSILLRFNGVSDVLREFEELLEDPGHSFFYVFLRRLVGLTQKVVPDEV